MPSTPSPRPPQWPHPAEARPEDELPHFTPALLTSSLAAGGIGSSAVALWAQDDARGPISLAQLGRFSGPVAAEMGLCWGPGAGASWLEGQAPTLPLLSPGTREG